MGGIFSKMLGFEEGARGPRNADCHVKGILLVAAWLILRDFSTGTGSGAFSAVGSGSSGSALNSDFDSRFMDELVERTGGFYFNSLMPENKVLLDQMVPKAVPSRVGGRRGSCFWHGRV